MFRLVLRSLFAEPYGSMALVRRVLAEHGPRHWKRYALAFAFMGVAAGCTSLIAYLIGDVVNQTYVYRDYGAIAALCALTIVLYAAKGLAAYGQMVVLSRIASGITAQNQTLMFDKLLREDLGYFAGRHTSEFSARVAYAAGAVPSVLTMLVTAFGRDSLSVIGLVTVMVVQDPLLSLVGLVVLPLAVLFVRDVLRRVHNVASDQFAVGASMMETLQETLQGLRIIKAFGLEEMMRRRVRDNAEAGRRATNEMARLSNRSSPLMESLGGFAVAAIFLYAGYRVIETGAQPGEFVSFITAFLLAYEPAKRLARLNIGLSASLVGVRLFYELLDSPPTEPEEDDKPPLRVSAGRIAFDGVTFAYRPNEPVLRGMSFVAEPGRVTALVGTSGGGKSTALSLILRLYEPGGGSIAIDGQDVAAVSRRSLRSRIGYVGQDAFLFRASIRDNIALGRPEASEEDIVAAAKAAHAHDFIMSFPHGYKTPVGEHGLQLSGGQRQRIAIARALVKDAPIVLMDEATASLDSESERLVRDAVAHLCRGRTTLVVAHRLHTIQHADCIHVVENGVVVESGRHEELLRRGGRYASFYRLQLKDGGTAPPDAAPRRAAGAAVAE